VPAGVKVGVDASKVSVTSSKGTLQVTLVDGIRATVGEGTVLVSRANDSREQRTAQGLMRRLIANMLEGVSRGFSKTLEITGVGYRADARGKHLHLTLGYSHPIVYQLPDGVTAKVENQTVITLNGADRRLVGEVAADIRKLRPPEPYKGKGVRYAQEVIRRKAGKAGIAKA
jgi:large subunit ribosomal protein L6